MIGTNKMMEIKNKNELKNTDIEQLSIAYNVEEDRLLFKIGFSNNYELSIWLTRRIANVLSELFDKTSLTNNYGQETSQVFENKESQNLDFSTQYQPRKPLQTGQSLLLVQQCELLTPANQPMNLKLLCTNKQTINLVLNDELLTALTNMLPLATRQANWDFITTDSLLIPNLFNSNTVLH